MATLKEHQAAMVELLANGSGIPASASRLAHAMHDVLEVLAKWPTPAEQRVKELENTISQLKANNAKLKKDIQDLRGSKMLTAGDLFGAEQAGCRKPDTQVCEHDWVATLQDDFRTCSKCQRVELI